MLLWEFGPIANCVGAAWLSGRGLLWMRDPIRTRVGEQGVTGSLGPWMSWHQATAWSFPFAFWERGRRTAAESWLPGGSSGAAGDVARIRHSVL